MDTAAARIENNRLLGWRMRIAAFVELTKPRIAFMLVLSSAAGFYLGTKGSFDFALFANAMIGIAILAFGVATLNQFMERSTDALMDRTKNRPLPSMRLTGRATARQRRGYFVRSRIASGRLIASAAWSNWRQAMRNTSESYSEETMALDMAETRAG